jgi:AbiV family abortive infection protein
MKKANDDRIIHRSEMPKGIDLCKQNVLDFLKDARIIINENRLSHAYISVQYSIEELGKILIFRDKIASSNSDPLVVKKDEAFGNHPNKTNRAWKFLDPKFKKIFDEGVWGDNIWEKGIWKENTYAEYQTILDCAFVDYYAKRWQLGRDIKKDLLLDLINHIEEKLAQA